MSGSSDSTQTSAPVFMTTPGATGELGYGTSSKLFNQATDLTGNQVGALDSPFSRSLEETLLNPKFGAQTDSENALLNSLMDVTAGRGAVSGLGAPTQSALASSIAPTMVGLRQQNIENLLSGRNQDIGLRAQDIQQWQTAIQALIELAGLAMPQTIGGSSTTGKSDSHNIVQDFLNDTFGMNL